MIYKVGGAQAVAALAYGTKSIPKVDKIVGPGNIYVALAKRAVYGHVSIDAVAGPSEILVIADETANPRYVAADLLSQAEHDELASAILVTTSETLARQVSEQADAFVEELSRSEIIRKSLDNYGYILTADTMEDAIAIANDIASEHVEIQTRNPFDEGPQCGRDLYRRLFQRTFGRLFCRSEPCTSYQRDGQVLFPAVGG